MSSAVARHCQLRFVRPVLELARAIMQKPPEVVLDEPDLLQGSFAQLDLRF
jgi:ABC-type Na+ transport system ATPase subunit NatA